MNKNILSIFTFFLITIISIGFSSCNNENDDDTEDTYNSYLDCPNSKHPHAIDLGLPSGTKWACCNVGASTPEGYGDFYAWGETNEKNVFDEVTYLYCTGTDNDGDGFYDENRNYQDLGSDIANTQYDVAHVKWKKAWQIPTYKQILELLDNCTLKQKYYNGINGCEFTGPNGGRIFLPATGIHIRYEIKAKMTASYWSSRPYSSSKWNTWRAYSLEFETSDTLTTGARAWWTENYSRYYGLPVRPVWVEK